MLEVLSVTLPLLELSPIEVIHHLHSSHQNVSMLRNLGGSSHSCG